MMKFINLFITLAFVARGQDAAAQASLVQQTIDKLEHYKNFGYTCVSNVKDFNAENKTTQYKALFVKAPADTIIGYLFKAETILESDKYHTIDLYNGQDLVHMTPADSTYSIQSIRPSDIQQSLMAYLKMLKRFFDRKPSVMAGDTMVNSVPCMHLITTTYDTIIGKEHCYTRIHLFIDKVSGLPDRITTYSHNVYFGSDVSDYYAEFRYFDYALDQAEVDLATSGVPAGYHLREEQPVLSLLPTGTPAPDWTLSGADGTKLSLSDMKGKVVLLEFFFIGCQYGMKSLKPLNELYEKYGKRNVVIVGVSDRDSQQAIVAFKKAYKLKYVLYGEGADVFRAYHVAGSPTFYLIDKKGRIARSINGFSEGFEGEVDGTIAGLLDGK